MSAGPAPTRITSPLGPNCPAAADPIEPKIPAPITAPMASITRSTAVSERFRLFGWPSSASSAEIGFRAKSDFIRSSRRVGPESDEQRSQHERDGAEQLDQHVQRRAGRVLERIANRVPDDRRLVGLGALAAVRTRLDVLLGVVPGAAAV